MKTWNNTDKTTWSEGPWKSEPDKAQWISSGLDCLIVRGPSGALCGYVGVPESHPLYGRDYDAEEVYVECHGGLTFADKCQPTDDPSRHVCHVAEDAANAEVWWFGFDCAHLGDLSPAYNQRNHYSDGEEEYRSFQYVQSEVEAMAKQLSGTA